MNSGFLFFKTLVTGVVQMLWLLNGRWSKISEGVLCFVKDYQTQNYFLRLFNLNSKKIIFQQRIRSGIRLGKSIDSFYTFDSEVCSLILVIDFNEIRIFKEKKFGINFVDAGEGAIFYRDFNEKQEQRSSKY